MASGTPATPEALGLPAAPPVLPRPDLARRLDEAVARRLTIVVAGAGFGKSTLLSSWLPEASAWYSVGPDDVAFRSLARGVFDALRLRVPGLPADIATSIDAPSGSDAEMDEAVRGRSWAALLCDALAAQSADDFVLVLDDVHEIEESRASVALIETLCRQTPPRLHLVVASRSDLPFPTERLRGQGHVLDLGAGDLAFTVEEVHELIGRTIPEDQAAIAGELHEATRGWPAAVRMAVEALRGVAAGDRQVALERIRRRGGSLFAYLASEVFDREPPSVRELVRTVAPLDWFTPRLCEALGRERAAETLASLARRGLFFEHRTGDRYSLAALVRDFARAELPLDAWERREVHARAAAWFESEGYLEEALASLTAIDDHRGVARILTQRGNELLARGAVETVGRAAESLPPQERPADVEMLRGRVLQIRGDFDGALACFRRSAGDASSLPPGLAWRMGLIHHLRGDLDAATEIYSRGRVDGSAPHEEAMLLTWQATASWLRSDVPACRSSVQRALEIATATHDLQAEAAAHTVLAMLAIIEQDPKGMASHYIKALNAAERAGDVLQQIRIRTNRGSQAILEGSYEDALQSLDIAIRFADLAGFANFRALGYTNRGLALYHLGRFDEAASDLEAGRSLYEQIGSKMVCYPLYILGDVHRARGEHALARSAYEEAKSSAESSGNIQGLVPALTGLARLLAEDEPEEAERLADAALEHTASFGRAEALLASARVALGRGDRERAREIARDAAARARATRDRAGLAEALEIEGITSVDPDAGVRRMDEAAEIWRSLRSPLGEARAELEMARRGGGARAMVERSLATFRRLGARRAAADAANVIAAIEQESRPPLECRTLGGFAVLRRGEPVPLTDWRSKKGRDLLRILVCRRGRPVPREVLMDLLWPDEDAEKVAHRFSVALNTLRGVLDPERRFGAGHFVAADKDTVTLRLDTVTVDVESFMSAATAGLSLRQDGASAEASESLAAAEVAYTGDFLEDSPYDDWSEPLRDEARAAYIAVASALADDAQAAGDHQAAFRYNLRVLERDRFNEPAHLRLVASLRAAGRHGEARRCYRTYCARMEELGVEAAPFPEAIDGRLPA